MKYLILVAMTYCSTVFAAAPAVDMTTQNLGAEVQTAFSATVMGRIVYCEAHTICRNGGRIACNSSGESCTSHENPGRDVECVGYSLPGYRGGSRRSVEYCR